MNDDGHTTNETLRKTIHIAFGFFAIGLKWLPWRYAAAIAALAAVGWVILAFGDGFATLIGRAVPIAPLPWNRAKSWGGTLAFIGFAALAGEGISIFFGTPSLLVVSAAVIVAAIVESMPLGIDDN